MAKPSSSLRGKFLFVFLVTSAILGVVIANNVLISGRFLREIGDTYAQSAKLYTFLEALKNTDRDYQDYLRSKSDVSLERYYRGADAILEELDLFNSDILADDSALLERDIVRLTGAYLEASNSAIQGKRARDIEGQRVSLVRSQQAYQYIVRYVGELNQNWFQGNYSYYIETGARVGTLQMVSTIIFVIVFFANTLFFVAFIRKTTEPLLILSQTSDAVSKGKYDVPPLHIDTQDEIAVLADAFDNMLRSIRQNLCQIEENSRQEIQYRKIQFEMENYLQEARLKSLQEQVNPHFLFNCLNTAAQLAMMENADTACRFMEDLADFYRYNLKISEKDTLLRNEIQSINTYVDIMRVRFGDTFAFHTNIDESLLDVRVPSLILQPIVENAFNHGIGDMEQDGEIILLVKKEGESILICVMDNGKGFSQEVLGHLFSDEDAPVQKDSRQSIGVANVARRIALYYGGDGLFRISNREDGPGAIVSIFIPLIHRKETQWTD